MKHIIGLIVTLVTLASCGVVATAQQPTKVPRIGYLTQASASVIGSRIEAFQPGAARAWLQRRKEYCR
jgi:hypothetical protein